jgi:hypothetical protein
MTPRRAALIIGWVGSCLVAVATISASGPVGIYGLIERVVFEPSESAAERVQLWGAFAYADGGAGKAGAASVARKGFMYFRLDPSATPAQRQIVRVEWADLKSVAGKGQAVAFGNWGYIGGFGGLDPGVRGGGPPYILEMYPGHGEQTDMRVRPASETPANPAVYQTNAGIVKLTEANHAAVIKALKESLARPGLE